MIGNVPYLNQRHTFIITHNAACMHIAFLAKAPAAKTAGATKKPVAVTPAVFAAGAFPALGCPSNDVTR
jgi:hypothetical protein